VVPEQIPQPSLRDADQLDPPGPARPASAEVFDQDVSLLTRVVDGDVERVEIADDVADHPGDLAAHRPPERRNTVHVELGQGA
jgi:hypothetical protein